MPNYSCKVHIYTYFILTIYGYKVLASGKRKKKKRKEFEHAFMYIHFIRSIPVTLLKHQAKHIECSIQVPRRCGIGRE